DVQGAKQLRDTFPDAIYIFLDAPDRDEALQRLAGRNTETREQVRRRVAAARRELEQSNLFDHQVINDDLTETVDEVRGLIRDAQPAGTDP
ncbi:MAG: guanylate kinase, partial [Planctomycetota bacterium]